MNDDQQSLWNRIEAFEMDDADSAFPFSARLAQENGWSRHYAQRVVAQYKRFVFLCVTAEHVACPSDQVDQAWHLHLTFTRSYWNQLCQEVLQRPLHHGPTKGGAAENRKHVDLYEQTLRSYRFVFGGEPPGDIWPPPEIRFGEDVHHRRVNTQRYWVLPKLRWPRQLGHNTKAVMAATLLLPMFGAALNPLTMPGPVFLVFYGVLFVFALTLSLVLGRLFRERDDGQDVALSPNAAACLAHADMAPIMTTVCRLIQCDSLELLKVNKGMVFKKEVYRLKTKGPLPQDAESQDPGSLAAAIYQGAESKDGVDLAKLIPDLAGHVATIRRALEQQGLLESATSMAASRAVPRYLLGGLLLLGAIKLVMGLAGGRPIGFLVIALVVTGMTLAFLSALPRRTRKGERILNGYQAEYAYLKSLDSKKSLTPDQLAMAAGLFGLGAFSAGGFDLIHDAWKTSFGAHGKGPGGSGCSAGCGGDGGGGCGGCGGCGGD